ncbi:BREX system ATP-binding domain-containing protein, partial [Pseudomonas aeruginosa]|uniref:BREX system ATP-binding domain-containing protein n=1 Tax=Pseudomonas aeruginosa TaxID=287 RepID=UPI0026E990BB
LAHQTPLSRRGFSPKSVSGISRPLHEALPLFMAHCNQRLGDAYFRTPRTTITAFINLLAVLEQNPGADWRHLLGAVELSPDRGGEADTQVDADDELATFQL